MTDDITKITEGLLAWPPVTLSAWDEVNAPMVRQWCDVMGNRNLRYARNDEIPATMLHVWTMPGFGGVFPEGETVDLLREASRQFTALGFSGAMAVRLQQKFYRPLTLGERLHRELSIESVSPVKRTAVGDGIFITEIATIFSQKEQVGTTRLTLLCFQPTHADEKEPNHAKMPSSTASNQLSLDAHFIISAAIATRDFEDVHIDQARARARGVKDIYLNIMTTLGLVQRFVEENHGSSIILDEIDLSLHAPAHPGDELRFASHWTSPNQKVEFTLELRDRFHARGIVQVAQP